MFVSERLQIIKRTINDKKQINVSDLSTILHVSEVTIRRDLQKLENINFLSRTHGGAIINEHSYPIKKDSLDVDIDIYYSERIEISQIAAQMIEDNDVILLSPGFINKYIAREILNRKNLIVLTNDLKIVSELSKNAGIKIIIPGGDLDVTSMTVIGKLSENNLKSFFVSKAFIEVDGVSMERGYTVQGIEKASMIKEMLEISKEKIIVCPDMCFDNIAFSHIGQLKIVNKIITNSPITDLYKDFFLENNIQLLQGL